MCSSLLELTTPTFSQVDDATLIEAAFMPYMNGSASRTNSCSSPFPTASVPDSVEFNEANQETMSTIDAGASEIEEISTGGVMFNPRQQV